MTLRGLTIRQQAVCLVAVAAAALIGVALHVLSGARGEIAALRTREAESALRAALTVMEEQQARVASGETTRARAEAFVEGFMRRHRFAEGEGYAAVLDDGHVVLVQPAHPETVGDDETNRQSDDGRWIAREAVAVGREGGIGYNTYPYVHPLTGEPAVKTSAIARFEPWGWTLIAGVFDTRLDATMARMTRQLLVESALAMALVVAVMTIVARSFTRPVRGVSAAMRQIADGDLDTPIPHAELGNEVGRMARALSVFRRNAAALEAAKADVDGALKAQASAAAAAEAQVAAAVNHEFRTPLAIIDAHARKLERRTGDNSADDEPLRRIRASVLRLTRLMEQTLTAAKAEVGTLRLTVGDVDLAALAADVVAEARMMHVEAAFSLDVARMPPVVPGDAGYLRTVLENLVSNAVKYSADAPVVRVQGWTEGGSAILTVEDSGVGIAPDDLLRIGERHFRAASAARTAGAGVGLHTAMLVARLHGGELTARSALGEGSTFTLRLPLAAAQPDAAQPDAAQPDAAGAA